MATLTPQEFKIQQELLKIHIGHGPTTAIGSTFAITMSVLFLWRHVPNNMLLWWAVGCYMVIFLRVVIAKYYLSPRVVRDPISCGWIYTALTCLHGASWGFLGVLFFGAEDIFVLVYVCLLVAGLNTTGVTSLSPFWPSYVAFAMFSIVQLAISAYFLSGELGSVLGFMLLFLLVVNLVYCASTHKIIYDSVSMRFENVELINQLSAEKDRAEVANRAKSQFLAAASHDLRQPTHALGLFIATLKAMTQREQLKNNEVENIADRLQTSLRNLSELLNALLQVSRLDAGVVVAEIRPIALQEILNNLANEFAGVANSAGLKLILRPTPLWVKSDPLVLRRVLANFLSNAIRYNQKGRVVLGCRQRQDFVEIQVWDNGVGIAPDQISKIFEEFYQVDNAARNREQGMGLGLSIVQRLVNLLGARLNVRSAVGKGSMFSVRLPIAAPMRMQNFREQVTEIPRKNKTVLIIDDDLEVLSAVARLISEWGHTPISVSTREQALAAASAQSVSIDFILADYRLAANAIGADVIRAVIAQLDRAVPAAIITGDTSPDRIREASASGYRLLHKPLNPDSLRLLLSEELGDELSDLGRNIDFGISMFE
jgi:signal transduction histidine kinase/CheY-like chemotaxis protein